MASAAFGLMPQPLTRNSVSKIIAPVASGGQYGNILSSTAGNPVTSLYLATSSQVSTWAGNQGPLQNISTNSTNIFSEQINGANTTLYKNGSASSPVNPGAQGINGIQIGSRDGNSAFSNVAISEITLFQTLLSSTDRQTLETNQSAYYTILVVGSTVWTGANSNSNWNDAANWNNGLPSNTVSATIPNVSPNPYPVITTAAQVSNLTINSGASLTLNNSLQVAGNLVNNGTLTNNNTLAIGGNLTNSSSIGGTVVLNGTALQNLYGTGTYSSLTLNNSGGNLITLNNPIRITNLLTITNGTLNLYNSDITLGSTSISNTAQVGPVGGSIIYPGTGRFLVERIISKADNSQSVVAYNNVCASVLTDQAIWANWQEGATTANYNPANGYGTQITGEYGATQGNDASTGIDYTNVSGGTQSMWTWDVTTQNYLTVLNTKTPTLKPYAGYLMYIIPRNINLYTVNQYSPIYFQQTILRSRGKLLTGNFTINSSVGAIYQLGGSSTYTDNSYKLAGSASQPIVNDSIYSLVGNPYAAAFDFNAAMANSGVSGLIKTQYSFFDGAIAQYVTWDATTGPSVATSAANQFIQPGQSIFLQNDFTTNTRQFIVTEVNKNTNPTNLTGVFEQNNPMAKLYLTLRNAQGGVRDGALLAQRADFSNQSIIGEDARKFRNPSENIAFVAGGSHWSIEKIQDLAAGDSLPIALWNLTLGTPYTLTANGQTLPAGWALYDAFTHTTHLLSATDSLNLVFTPTTDTNTYLHRFSIIRVKAATQAITNFNLQIKVDQQQYHLYCKVEPSIARTGPDYVWERSTDSVQFEAIGQSNATHDTLLQWTDNYIGVGKIWYRIRANAADRIFYSNTVTVDATPNMSMQVYPNPSDGQSVSLSTLGVPDGLYRVNLYNYTGQLVSSQLITINGNNTAQTLRWQNHLAAGAYYLQLQSATKSKLRFTETILIQKH